MRVGPLLILFLLLFRSCLLEDDLRLNGFNDLVLLVFLNLVESIASLFGILVVRVGESSVILVI